VGAGKTQLVLGKHSGRHAVGTRLAELGHALEGAALDRVFERFKTLADKKKSVSDADLEALVHDTHVAPPGGEFELVDLMVSCGTQGLATATVRVKCPDGNVAVSAIIGSGPVDAAFKAIDAIVDAPVTLLEYLVHAVTEGIDALGEVSVRIREGEGATVYGNGADTDIVVASAKAYLKALNKVVAGRPIRSGRMERIALENQATGAVS
jgi:2-isopropylmalate synthase